MDNFDLLNYLNDDNLIATLGIATPISVTDESCAKLLGADVNTYADLLQPTTHLSTNYNSVTGHETEYYTIDTEVSGNNGDSLYQATPLPVQINATQPIVVTDAQVTNSTPAWNHMQDTSVIIVSSAECESDTPVSIAFQNSISDPASIESASKSLELDNRTTTDARIEIAEKPVKKPRRRRPKKDKIYEITEQFEDPVLEKKRLNAINAKKNRDRKKNMLRELGDKVSLVTKERDELRKEVLKLKEREHALRQQLEAKYGVSLPSF